MTKRNGKTLTNYVPAQGKPQSFIRYFQDNPDAGVRLFQAMTLVMNEIDNGTLTPTSQNAAQAAGLARDMWLGIMSGDQQEERRAA